MKELQSISRKRKLKWLFPKFFLLYFLLSVKAGAQNSPVGTFNVLSTQIHLNRSWIFFVEPEFRSLSFYNRFFYYEIKGGISYAINKQIMVSLGGGIYKTFQEGVNFENYSRQEDFRIWEQAKIKQEVFLFFLEHRVRIEEVLRKNFAINFRYSAKAKIPLNRKDLISRTLYGAFYDEVFFTSTIPHFNRNRIFGGFGYLINKAVSFEGGLLRQNDFAQIMNRGKNYLLTSVSLSF